MSSKAIGLSDLSYKEVKRKSGLALEYLRKNNRPAYDFFKDRSVINKKDDKDAEPSWECRDDYWEILLSSYHKYGDKGIESACKGLTQIIRKIKRLGNEGNNTASLN